MGFLTGSCVAGHCGKQLGCCREVWAFPPLKGRHLLAGQDKVEHPPLPRPPGRMSVSQWCCMSLHVMGGRLLIPWGEVNAGVGVFRASHM